MVVKASKSGIYDVGGRELLVPVLEDELVLGLFRHLHPDCGLADTLALWLVGLQQVLPGVAVEAALAEMHAVFVFALVIQQSIKVLDEHIVELACLLDKKQVNPGSWLIPELVDNDALVSAEDIDG